MLGLSRVPPWAPLHDNAFVHVYDAAGDVFGDHSPIVNAPPDQVSFEPDLATVGTLQIIDTFIDRMFPLL